MHNILANILVQSFAFGIGFYVIVNWLNPAPEILSMAHDFVKVTLPGFFKKKR
jgi:hypothetical protein